MAVSGGGPVATRLDALLAAMPVSGGGAVAPRLDALLAAIPIAQDDDVITRDYHNSLREAILELASRTGGGPQQATLSFAPILTSVDRVNDWVVQLGYASKPIANDANG